MKTSDFPENSSRLGINEFIDNRGQYYKLTALVNYAIYIETVKTWNCEKFHRIYYNTIQ